MFEFINSIECKTIYVNQIAEGQQIGDSWDNAFTDLKVAIFEARYGDTIWVAQGTYTPVSNLRSDAFFIKNGLAVFGGFQGIETSLEERNVELYQTILSGERGDTTTLEDNHFHVVSMTNVDSTTILDGFLITKGYAFDEEAHFNHHSLRGGGLFLENNRNDFNTNPVIRNCSFIQNTGRIGGAAHIKSEDENNQFISPLIENCYFYRNRAIWTGGAIYKEGGSSSFKITNTVFMENKVDFRHGGAIHFLNSHGKNSISNCLFEKDSTRRGEGGAIFYETRRADSELRIINSEFKDNFTNTDGGAIELASLEVSLNKNNQFFLLDSCVFENNYSFLGVGGALAISNVSSQYSITVNHSTFLNNYARNGGGSIHSQVSSDSIILNINNCSFYNNKSVNGVDGNIYLRTDANPGISYQKFQLSNSVLTNNAGAFSVYSGSYEGKGESIISNCTSYKNGIAPVSKNWSADFDGITRYNNMKIVNSIFYEAPRIFNSANPSMEEIFFNNNLDSLHLSGYQFENCWINAAPITACDTACGKNLIFNEYPLFINADEGDFSLVSCSPAINAGLNLPDFSLTDLVGNPRVKDDIIDIGAIENEEYLPIMVDFEQINASSGNSADGALTIEGIRGGTPPYQYNWDNGATTDAIQNLAPDKYNLTITDSEGCEEIFAFEITFTNRIVTDEYSLSSTLYPNPIFNGRANLKITSSNTGNFNIQTYDMVGRLINQQPLPVKHGDNIYSVKIPEVKGLYLLAIRDNNARTLKMHKVEVR